MNKTLKIVLIVGIVIAIMVGTIIGVVVGTSGTISTDASQSENIKQKLPKNTCSIKVEDLPKEERNTNKQNQKEQDNTNKAKYTFELNNVSFSTNKLGFTEIIGELKNNDTKGYAGVAFTINIYDDDGNLLATSPNVVNNLGPGDAKSFTSVLPGEYPNATQYRVQIDAKF